MSSVILTMEEYKMLVGGQFKVFKCTSCFGKGWYWVHEEGVKRDPLAGESEDDFYQHECVDESDGDCGGSGFRVVYFRSGEE